MRAELSHLNARGEAAMVDVGGKSQSSRRALVSCEVRMSQETLSLLKAGKLKKGDAFTVAKIAGIQVAKKTSDLIPLCHPLPLDCIEVDFKDLADSTGVLVLAEVKTTSKTGVEMEAFTAASVAALTLYDMAKAVEPKIVITQLQLIEKTGGKSDFTHPLRRSYGK